MLDDIEELRYAIAPAETEDEPETMEPKNGLGIIDVLFGSTTPISYDQILARCLPTRLEADRLTASYFRSKAIAVPFIHAAQFRRQYQAFWRDPSGVQPLWTSIFFSICHIASNSLSMRKETSVEDVKFSIAAAHCLAVGEYFRPKRYAVESLCLWAQSRCFTSLDLSPDVATAFGLLIRLATRMGYHRDPDHFNLSLFEREMRRRTWSLCIQLDLLISFQMGLPSNVQFPTWDTRPPTNLLDIDFDEDTKVLPPARPDTELTDIMFYNSKHRLVEVFEKILRHALSTEAEHGASVDELDAELRRKYDALPEILRPRPMTESIVDPPYLMVTRLCVLFMFLKSMCVLHRKHVTQGRVASIQAAYEASSELVKSFVDAYYEFQPGGQNESEMWFMSSLTWNDFLLGSMVLCLVSCATNLESTTFDIDSAKTMELLRKSQSVCIERANKSKDTQRVRRLVEATISRFAMPVDAATSLGSQSGMFPSTIQSNSSYVSSSGNNQQYAANGSGQPYGTQPDSMFSGGVDWAWDESVATTIDDVSWSYLEQFLNIPGDDFMANA